MYDGIIAGQPVLPTPATPNHATLSEAAMAVDQSTRVCSKCRQALPLTMFSRRGDGYAYYCKPCHKAYAKAHYAGHYRQIALQKTKEWREKNRERRLETYRRYYELNKERLIRESVERRRNNPKWGKEVWTRWRMKNLDHARAIEAAYRERNREICNARIREWKAKNKARLAEYSRRRQAAQLGATPKWANIEAIRAFYVEAERRRLETGQDWHVDHIVPLISKEVCGLHCEANLQILPGKENLSKNNRRWPDMP